MSVSAKYIISAVDQTKATIQSIRKGFKSLDDGAKTTGRSINFALGTIAGYGLKNLFKNVLEATYQASGTNSEFAQSVDKMRESFRTLLTSKDGLPEATRAINELTESLNDPETRAAFDRIATGIIKVGSGIAKLAVEYASLIAKGWKGWQVMLTGEGGNEAVDIDTKIRKLQSRAQFFSGDISPGGRSRYREIMRDIEELQRRYEDVISGGPKMDKPEDVDVGAMIGRHMAGATKQFAAMDAAAARAEEIRAAQKEIAQDIERMSDQTTQTIIENGERAVNEHIDNEVAFMEFMEEMRNRGVEEHKESLDKMSEYAKSAAQNMQGALADFLFDPFENGLKGMLRGFIDTIRRMVAEAAAAKIFDSMGGGDKILGSIVSVGKSLLGFAHGGNFTVGGHGGTDSQLVAFRATPGEKVSVNPAGRGGGSGVVVAPVYNIDARGATQDLVKALPGILEANTRRAVELARLAVRDDMSRGAFA